jgi:hypothetical protein
MVVDDALDDGQTDAVAGELVRAMQTLERAKQLIGVFHVKSGPVVTNEIGLFTIVIIDAELYPALLVLAGKFPTVVQDVL